jgi:hypothetical protein
MRTLTLLAAAVLALTGCYSSSVPLGTVDQAEFDPALLGTWVAVGPATTGTPDELVVRRKDEREYELRFTYTAPFSTNRTTQHAEGYVVRVEGVPFLNVRDLESDEPQWMFFRYETLGTDGLRLRSFRDDIDADPAFSDLLTFVERNLHRTSIYTDAARFRRKG